MPVKLFYTLALVMALGSFVNVRAAEGDKPKGGGGGKIIQMILDKGDELGLTADQKSKLQEMAKGPMSILTDEQKKKVQDMLPKGGPGDKKGKKEAGGDGPKKPGGDKKPNGDEGDKKPDGDKKADGDKKPEEKKGDAEEKK